MNAAARFPHLARRFFSAVSARVDPTEYDLVARYCSPAEQSLFRSMRLADQRHSLDLCRRLERDGHLDPDLLRAALLHDVGKSFGPLPLALRVFYALCRLTSPPFARWLARADHPTWRRPFYLAAHHAEIGARAARAAGSRPDVVALIGGHESPGCDERSRLLFLYDGDM